MRPIVLSVALMLLSAAFNLTVGKYASNVPDWVIIACWLLPLVPLVWVGLGHPKLLRHRQWYQDRLKSRAVSTIVLTAIVGCVILFSAVGFAHGIWKTLTKPQPTASSGSPNQQQQTFNSSTAPLPAPPQTPPVSQPNQEAQTTPAQRPNTASKKVHTASEKTPLPVETHPTIGKSGNSLQIKAGDGGSNGSPGGSLTIRGGDGGNGGNGGNVLISAGDITPLDPNDPYAAKTDREVANLALEEADIVQRLAQECLDDLGAVSASPPKQPHYIVDSTPDATRSHFKIRVSNEIETIRKIHDSILARVPTLRDRDMESYYQYELQNKDGCWLPDYDNGVPKYLRQLSQGLLAHRRARN